MPVVGFYLVSADHKVAEYSFTDTLVRVGKDSGANGGFFADHPKLGCGKNFRTEVAAIEGLFKDHACTNIRARLIEDVNLL